MTLKSVMQRLKQIIRWMGKQTVTDVEATALLTASQLNKPPE